MATKIARLSLTGKVLLAFAAGGVLTLLVSAMAWLSFQQIATSQRAIIDDAMPTMDAAQSVAHLNLSLIALAERLGRAEAEDEVGRLEVTLREQLAKMRGLLAQERIERLSAHGGGDPLQSIEANLRQQSLVVRQRIVLRQQERVLLTRHQRAARALASLSESLVANALATPTATISTLYPQLEGQAPRDSLLESLDRLVEVNLDHMERMSELQLVCLTLKTLLEQFDNEYDATALAGLERRFASQLEVLGRRLSDIGDPTRRASGLEQFKTLSTAVQPNGLFAIRAQGIRLIASFQGLRDEGTTLATTLSDWVGALVNTAGKSIDVVSNTSRHAYNVGFIGFLMITALLFLVLVATLWALFHFQVFGRLRGMEQTVRALASGNYDADIPVLDNDPLAPLGRALEQFRVNARERQRLENELLRHHQELEGLVASRTAELRQSNALLEQVAEEHEVARREAEEANRAKAVFLANLSHELRTPLSGIAGSAQLLADTGLDARQGEYIRMISYANSTLLDIVEDMLSFSRLEAGKFDLEPTPIALREVIDDMLALQRVSVGAKNIVLIRDIAADVPELVEGDRRKLNQILLNLIGNAIKFTDEGSVTLSVQRAAASEGSLRLRFLVSDTGIGIPPDQCEEVFKPFVQVEDTGHRRQQGTGLGLAICRRLVELMGGEIHMDSVLGQGTQVSFELPLEVPDRLPGQATVDVSNVRMPKRPLEVLVVEDDEINRTVCERYLESLGHRPIVLGDGEAALELLHWRSEPLDAALLDISLPGMSGLEVAQQIRQSVDGHWLSLPIIVMSAHVAGNTTAQFTGLGVACFLGKPFDRNALAKALAEAVAGGGEPMTQLAALEAGAAASAQDESLLDQGFIREELDSLGAKTLVSLLALFRQDAEAAMAELGQHAALNDWSSFGKRAHRLAGAAGNLGFRAVIALARRLESAAGEAAVDKAQIARMLEAFRETSRLSCATLADKLAATDSG